MSVMPESSVAISLHLVQEGQSILLGKEGRSGKKNPLNNLFCSYFETREIPICT